MMALLLALPAQAVPELPPYGYSIRCAALAEAATAAAGVDTVSGRKYWDAALFWGLAASERAQRDHITAPRFKQDQVDARDKAAAELNAKDAAATAMLAKCMAEVRG